MQRFRSSILVISLIVIGIAASLLTVLGLYFAGILKTERVELVFSVQSVAKVYDGTPLVSQNYQLVSGELIEGHVVNATIVGEQTDVGTGASSLEVKITNEKGFDVSNEYAVKVETGALIVSPAEIYVSLLDEEVVYNGKKVIFENYVVDQGRLVNGHRLGGSLPNIGLVGVNDFLPEDLVPVVFDADGKDVSSNYRIAYNFDGAGEIHIIPRPISVAPVSVRKTYDGVELVAEDFKIISGSLAEDQWAEVVINGGYNKMTDAGIAMTEITEITIYAMGGGNPVDVTENYTIDVSETGTMQIDRSSLVITAKSATWTYDGEEHSLTDDFMPEIISGLAPTDTLVSVLYEGAISEVGEVVNEIAEITLSSSTDNYNVLVIPGKLTVTPFRATVSLKNFTKEYDGKTVAETFGGETLFNVSPALPDGFNILPTGGLPNETNAGSYTYTLGALQVSGDGGDCTRNFELTQFDGTVTINRRVVTVTTKTNSKEYDGNALSEETPAVTNGVEGHTVSKKDGVTAPSQTDAGSVLNEFECVIRDGATDVTDNYQITYSYGTLTVTKKAVSFNLNDVSMTYNGNVLSVPVDDAFNGIALDQYNMQKSDFEIRPLAEIKNVGQYAYSAILKKPEDVKNYDLTVGSGMVKVEPAELTITYGETGVGSVSKIYDGKPLKLEMTAFKVGENLSLVSVDYAQYTLYGSYTINKFSNAQVRNANGEDVTGNYTITCTGTVNVRINARMLTFSLSDYFYKGSDYPDTLSDREMGHCVGLVGSLAEGDWFDEISCSYNPTDHTIRISSYTVRNAEGQDVTNCYNEDRLPTAQVILVQE